MLDHILLTTQYTNELKLLNHKLKKAKGLLRHYWLTHLDSALHRLGIREVQIAMRFNNLGGHLIMPQMKWGGSFKSAALEYQVLSCVNQDTLKQENFNDTKSPQTLLTIEQHREVDSPVNHEKMWAEIALNSITDAVICTNLSAHVDYLNASAIKITGWSREEAYGLHINEVFNIVDGLTREAPLENPVLLVLEKNEPMGLNAGTLLIPKGGIALAIEDSISPIRDDKGDMTGAVIVFHDVSAAYEMTKKMEHLAQHDFLTNLPNRLLLNDRIAQAISLAKRTNKQLAVLFLDLDNFKIVNDSLGHETGDKLLQSVTQRLSSCVRRSDTVSRQGGDEFVILLTGSEYGVDASLTAQKIIKALSFPHNIMQNILHITTSIGISLYPEDGHDALTLIKNADTAMYDAKGIGRNNYKFFRNEMNIRAVDRQLIESQLRLALEREEFTLYYQPKVNLKTGRIKGAEALLRWQHPEWGITSPEKFITIAENSGLIVPIGNWVLRAACMQTKRWLDAGLTSPIVAVNISAIEFHQDNFVENICQVLSDSGLDAHYLQLEITETVLIRNANATAKILQQLRNMHIQIALDDFGTGYSSLSYLKQFPIDVLKIDKSFICDIHSTADDAIIISAIIALGNNLKLCVVAEGIENKVQLEFLKTKQCEQGQGDYFSPPLEADKFEKLIYAEQS